MQCKSWNSLFMLGVSAIVVVATTTGCVRARRPLPPEVVTTTQYIDDRAVIVHRSDDNQRRYYRDNDGKLYYVDDGGAVHSIDRNVRVERGTAGLYYIVDDDNDRYYTNEEGRLYYRDTSGGVIHIEESGAGRVIDPLPILRGESYPRIEHVRSLDYCNDTWRKCNSSCGRSSGLNSKRSCYSDCDYQREQCLKPY